MDVRPAGKLFSAKSCTNRQPDRDIHNEINVYGNHLKGACRTCRFVQELDGITVEAGRRRRAPSPVRTRVEAGPPGQPQCPVP